VFLKSEEIRIYFEDQNSCIVSIGCDSVVSSYGKIECKYIKQIWGVGRYNNLEGLLQHILKNMERLRCLA